MPIIRSYSAPPIKKSKIKIDDFYSSWSNINLSSDTRQEPNVDNYLEKCPHLSCRCFTKYYRYKKRDLSEREMTLIFKLRFNFKEVEEKIAILQSDATYREEMESILNTSSATSLTSDSRTVTSLAPSPLGSTSSEESTTIYYHEVTLEASDEQVEDKIKCKL